MEGDYPWRFHPSSLSSPFIFHEISTQQYHDFNYCNPEKKSNDNGGSSMAGFTFDTDSVAHLNYFNEEFMSEVQKYQLLQKLIGNGDVNPMNKVSDQKLLLPKSEPVDEEEEEEEEELFRSGFLNSIDHTSSYHHGLMELQNVDHQFPLLLHEPYLKRSHVKPNFPLPASSSHPQKYLTLKSSTTSKCSSLQGKGIPQSIIARQRRKRISDRTQCLEKLMPWEKKMNTGTMLEEAYKYIKFLKAQVSVLESMPCQSSFITNSNSQMMMTTTSVNNVGSCYGGLEKLNRQQLLEVLVNSPVAQTILYSKECCVYSIEQLILLNNNFHLNQMSSSSSSTSSNRDH